MGSVAGKTLADFPDLVKQIDRKKHPDLEPKDIAAGSNKKVWWKCNKGHEFDQAVSQRTIRNSKCPYCIGRRINRENSFGSKFTKLLSEWDYEKNKDLDPYTLAPFTHHKVWWTCKSCDRNWKAAISDRSGGKGCAKCAIKKNSDKQALPKEGESLAELSPHIAKQWHPTKNGEIKPENVSDGSGRKYWWKCPEGPDHEWLGAVKDRTRQGGNCSFCINKRLSVTNNLEVKNPNLAKQWHPTKNGKLLPSQVITGSNKKFWWICDKGADHEWEASPNSRTSGGELRACPFCTGHRPCISNSFETKFPNLIYLWDTNKNNSTKPSMFLPNSNKKYNWKCPEGPDHEWAASPASIIRSYKTSNKSGCPYCAGNALSETNSLETLFPEIALEWHPTKNGQKTPRDVQAHSHKRYWWKCHNGHEWQARRTRGKRVSRDCPKCNLRGKSKIEIRLGHEFYGLFDKEYLENPEIEINEVTWKPDIVISEHNLIIEYDGYAYHSGNVYGKESRKDFDRKKTETLIVGGWKVIRIRETPLEKIGPNDILIDPPEGNDKLVVDKVIKKLQELGIENDNFQTYLARPNLLAKRAADEYIAKLQKEAEQETLNF